MFLLLLFDYFLGGKIFKSVSFGDWMEDRTEEYFDIRFRKYTSRAKLALMGIAGGALCFASGAIFGGGDSGARDSQEGVMEMMMGDPFILGGGLLAFSGLLGFLWYSVKDSKLNKERREFHDETYKQMVKVVAEEEILARDKVISYGFGGARGSHKQN